MFDTTNQLYGDVISYTADKDARIFVYANEKLYDLMMRKFRDSENIQTTIFPGMNGEIIDIGDVKKGDTLVFKTDDRENSSFNLVIGVMDYDSYNDAVDLLTEQKMNVIEYSGNYVKASVNVTDADRTKLFTSIPYGKGWSAYVDGKKTECENFMGAFVTLALSSGEHIVEFRYETPGLLLGGIISGVAILLLAILTICKRHPFLLNPLNLV